MILDCEANALEILNCNDKQQVFLQRLWNQFKCLVTKEISERLNIKYYYEAYDIIVNSKHIDRTLKKYELDGSKSILNYNILDSLITSLDKAELKVDDNGDRKYDDKFISDTKKMIDTAINSECKCNLSDEISKYNNKMSKLKKTVDNEVPF